MKFHRDNAAYLLIMLPRTKLHPSHLKLAAGWESFSLGTIHIITPKIISPGSDNLSCHSLPLPVPYSLRYDRSTVYFVRSASKILSIVAYQESHHCCNVARLRPA